MWVVADQWFFCSLECKLSQQVAPNHLKHKSWTISLYANASVTFSSLPFFFFFFQPKVSPAGEGGWQVRFYYYGSVRFAVSRGTAGMCEVYEVYDWGRECVGRLWNVLFIMEDSERDKHCYRRYTPHILLVLSLRINTLGSRSSLTFFLSCQSDWRHGVVKQQWYF